MPKWVAGIGKGPNFSKGQVFAKFTSQVFEGPSFLPRRAKFQSYFADKVYSELTFIGALNGLNVVKSEGHK